MGEFQQRGVDNETPVLYNVGMSNTFMVVACRWCGSEHTLPVDFRQFREWQNGELIQNAMPELDADQRELLISGTCPKCWDEMFPPSDEDE